MNKELIEHITKITQKVLNERLTQAETQKQVLVIFDTTQIELDIPLQQLEQCKQAGYKIRIILSQLATITMPKQRFLRTFTEHDILHEHQITNIPDMVEAYQHFVLPAFSYPMAAKLALKIVDTPCTYLVFEALRRGKQVLVTSDALNQERSHAASFLHKLEEEYVNILSELGVQWIQAGHIAETLAKPNNPRQATVNADVISASVIANLTHNIQELLYTNPAIITPLAREIAKKRGIKLIPKRTN